MEIKKIKPQDINRENGIILDVRTEMECAEKRLCCDHMHVPLDRLDAREFMAQTKLTPESNLYILCRSGQRASQAAEKFIAAGLTNVQVIEGGILGCEACGEKLQGRLIQEGQSGGPKMHISLERQVRIAAGLFVLIGTILGFYLSAAFLLVPVFVGAGLIFAGVTDRCGLALVLTKAPWNKIS